MAERLHDGVDKCREGDQRMGDYMMVWVSVVTEIKGWVII